MQTQPVVLSAIAVMFFLARAANGATLHVPADFLTIHEALDAAISGDEVVVAPGNYSTITAREFTFKDPPHNVTFRAAGFLKAGVTLRSEAGAEATFIRVLEPGNVHGLVMAQPPEDSPTFVQGFTFLAPLAEGAAILTRELLDDGTLLVQDCIFEDLDGGLDEAGGIFSIAGGSVRVISSEFRNVSSMGDYGAIGTAPGSLPLRRPVHLLEVQGSTFQDCAVSAIHSAATRTRVLDSHFTRCGALRALVEQHVLVQDCSFSICGVSLYSIDAAPTSLGEVRGCAVIGQGGIISGAPRTIVEDCHFVGSCQVSFTADGTDDVIFRRNVFREVDLEGFFGLVWGHDVIGEISNNTFVECSTFFGQSALLSFVTLSGELRLHHNIFAQASSGVAVEVDTQELGVLSESCNCYWQNFDGDTSGFDMSPTSFEADPRFCDPSLMEVTIRSDSPCAPPGPTGCGLVGAGAVACEPTALDSSSWGSIKALYR